VAPLHHPVRLAEDAAVCDLIARGRLILGLAKGWRPEEFEGLGIPLRGRHLRFEDTVATLRQAWSAGLATGGPHLPLPGMSVTPKPARPGGPPVWVGGTLEPAIRRAGRIGDGFMASWVTPEQLVEQASWARDEVERAGRDPVALAISTVVPVFVSEAPDPWALARDAFWHYVWKYEDMAEARGRLGPPPAPPPLGTEREEALQRLAVVGRPEEVAERLAAYGDVEPGVHLVAEAIWPALDRGALRECMALLAERVLPMLRTT
jgi:alkanesulfonate monooxygenase SsuD/methylene tetrahydromethanopterin reductase-like flavin-dependent oxidoreductase (luciferase family)